MHGIRSESILSVIDLKILSELEMKTIKAFPCHTQAIEGCVELMWLKNYVARITETETLNQL